MITINRGIECHIPLDLSGIVAFSTGDLSTSFIQFDLSNFSACRSQDGQLDLEKFSQNCKKFAGLDELKKQLMAHEFLIWQQ